jgi:hypothetical protein
MPSADLPDDIGNRIQPVAPPRELDEERQPASNASAQFPSSGPASPNARPMRGSRRGPGPVPALLRGGPRRGG